MSYAARPPSGRKAGKPWRTGLVYVLALAIAWVSRLILSRSRTQPRPQPPGDITGDAGRPRKKTRLIRAAAVVWIVVIVTLVIWGRIAQASATPNRTDCEPKPVPGVPVVIPQGQAELKPRTEAVTIVPFSLNRTVQHRHVEYDVTDRNKILANVSGLDVFVGQFSSSDNSVQLNAKDINAVATLKDGRVLLDVCFNRTDPDFGAPASYLGTVSIVDPRVTRTDVTFNVTLSYPWWQFVFALFLAMLVPAMLYVWFLRGSFQSHEGLTLDLLQKWLFSRTALMALGSGFAAAVSVFSAIYAKTQVWGTDWTSATALFGATFSAFVAAATAVTAAGSDRSAPDVTNGTKQVTAPARTTSRSESAS